MADTATLTKWLAEAEKSYHMLATGMQAKVFVDQNGERIEYNSASLAQLAKYINELKRQLGLLTVTGPLNVWM